MCTEDLPDGRMSRLVPHSHALYPHLLLVGICSAVLSGPGDMHGSLGQWQNSN